MSGTAAKLRLRAGGTALFIKSPAAVREAIAVPPGARITHCGKGPFDVVVAFVHRARDVAMLFDKADRGLAESGTLWMAYPKRGSGIATDVSGSVGWAPLTAAGWCPGARITIDASWSAIRFKPDATAQSKRIARGFGLAHKANKRG